MDKNYKKRFQLCEKKIKTIEDVKKILGAMQIRIDNDNPLYEDLKDYFVVEVVPKGYFKVLEKVGLEKLYQMTPEKIEEMAKTLIEESEQNEKH